jgi:predicted dehydrogenase
MRDIVIVEGVERQGGEVSIRIGLVGVNTSHADAFSRILNGTRNGSEGEGPALDSGRIVAIWGGDSERTKTLSTRHRIETTVGDPGEMIGSIDAALVIDDTDGGGMHATLARPFIEAGIPVYIDKPMTTEYADAVALFDLAERHDTPIMSCSALRFAVELEAARTEFEGIGTLSSIVSVGPGDWYYYGPTAVVETLRDAAYVFHLTAFGADGFKSVEVTDSSGFYTNTMREVVRMVETGTSPLGREQTLEVLAILEAGNRSAHTGARVDLTGIRGG